MKKTIIALVASFMLFPALTQAQKTTFEDVNAEHFNSEAINFLRTSEIIEGYSDGTYKPENRINRAEFVKILIESQIQNPSGSFCFSDVKDQWYAPYVCTAKRLGYVQGYNDNTFKPSDKINFAEASKIITKVLDIKPDEANTQGEWYAGFVNSLGNKRAIPTTIQQLDREITRGEMAEIIWRIKENKTDEVSLDYQTLSDTFPNIESCEVLYDQFDSYQRSRFYPHPLIDDVMFLEDSADFETGAPAPTATQSKSSNRAGESAEDFSTTNIQVEGVDEADIIKNDGKYIYLIKGNTIRIVDAFPANEMEQISTIKFEDEGFNPQEMFINKDQLIVIGNSYLNYSQSSVKSLVIAPRRGSSRTNVYIFDISNRNQPKQEKKFSFEGNYSTSRRIGNQMVMVMNQYPHFWVWDRIANGQELVPQFQVDDESAKPLMECGDIRYFPGYAEPNYLIITSITLDDLDKEIEREVFLGSSENVYSSTKNLYVATTDTNYGIYTDWDWREDKVDTLVYKFNIENGKVEFQDRGRVDGRILNQFSMDEYKDHFRIATTLNSWSADESTNQVYVLDKDMEKTGEILDIAPGERIFSTRFMGEKLYMVTFRQVDPLFVISLEDPKNPKILGQLKIPGFSDYLHPFDENHIIGFGKDTEETKEGNVLTKGFKMALFDVSDVTNPIQKFSEIIGDRGTYSELLNNHKALLFDKEKELLAFPINIMEKVSAEKLECSKSRYDECPALCQRRCIPSSCSEDEEGRAVCTDDCNGLGSCTAPEFERYNTTFSGAVVYSLNEKEGFKQTGKISHYDEMDLMKIGDFWPYDYQKNIQRILYIDKALYTISQSQVRANDLNSIESISSIKLD